MFHQPLLFTFTAGRFLVFAFPFGDDYPLSTPHPPYPSHWQPVDMKCATKPPAERSTECATTIPDESHAHDFDHDTLSHWFDPKGMSRSAFAGHIVLVILVVAFIVGVVVWVIKRKLRRHRAQNANRTTTTTGSQNQVQWEPGIELFSHQNVNTEIHNPQPAAKPAQFV